MVVLFLVLMTLIVAWTEYSTLVVNSTSFNSLQPSISAVFMLMVVTLLINPMLRLLAPRLALRGRQVIMLYAMLLVGSPVSDIGLVHFLVPSISSSYYSQRPENRWEELFGDYRAPWASPQGAREIREFWESGMTGVPWALWWKPMALWVAYGLASFWVMICLNLIIRRQWVDHERLTFPLVYLPLEMARDEHSHDEKLHLVNGFLRNPLTWVGAALAIIPQTFQGLNNYYPQLPYFDIKEQWIDQYFRDPPWNAVGQFSLNMYPCLVGFGYLLTTEVAFSVWFFYLFTKVERIFGRAVGWTDVGRKGMSAFPFEEHQGIGAWLVLIVFGLWIGRRYYADVLRAATGGKVSWISRQEAATYRLALIGAILGLVAMIVFAAYLGMDVLLAAAFFVVYFIFVMALTRIRAEAGLGCISGPLTLQEFFVTAAGSEVLGPRNLTALQAFWWQTVEFRGPATLMPCQLEGMKMAEETKLKTSELIAGIALALVFSAILGAYFTTNVAYQFGGINLNNWRFRDVPVTPYKRLASWISTPTRTDWLSLTFTLAGAACMTFLTVMRINTTWWPFHPVGFAAAMTKRMVHLTWFPAFIAWAFKSSILRYGGYKLYRKLVPLFLGLVVGDFLIGGVFGIVGVLVQKPGYCVFP